MKLYQVHEDEIDYFWPIVRQYIMDVVEKYEDQPTEEEIVESLKENTRKLWVLADNNGTIAKLALVTQMRKIGPEEIPVMVFQYTSGEGFGWQMSRYLPIFYEYARNNGMRYVGAYCIPTLARILVKKFGWQDFGPTPWGFLCLYPVLVNTLNDTCGEYNEDLQQNCA